MKKIVLSLIFPVSFIIQVNAQWITQTSPVTFEARGVHMTSSQVGYVAGSEGTILKTTDAGNNWYSLSSGTTDTLRSVFFVNDQTGFVVGAQGTILKTTNAGLTWAAQASGVTNLLRSVFFVDSLVGYACGGGGVILKTTNGGTGWVQQVSGITNDLINIRFIDQYTGYAVSSLATFLSGNILKTTKGGETWTSVYTHADGFLGLAVKGSVVYAGGGYETIVKSADAGLTWTEVNPPSANAYHFRSAAFISADTGWVTGDNGMIYYTTGGGATWTNQAINTAGILSVFIVNKDTVFACGTAGTILRYTTSCLPGPAAAILGDSSVCTYDTAELYVHPVPNTLYYYWQVPPFAQLLSGQGDTLIRVYFGLFPGTVSVVDSNLCGSSAPTQLNVTVNAAPPIPTITQNGSYLTSSATAGNQWYLNGSPISGAIGQNYTFTQNGTYTVKASYSNGCSSMSLPYVVTNTGIDALCGPAMRIEIIPNPVNQMADIRFDLIKPATVAVSVFDVLGSKMTGVTKTEMQEGPQRIILDCTQLSPGIYFLKLEAGNGSYCSKFIRR